MNSTGTAVWSGGFEPFGRDFTVPSAESFGMFLRLPGQWEDPFFDPSTLGVNLHYNLHRWYEPGTGRYISGDPIPIIETQQFYVYASNRPLVFIDLYGLYEIVPGHPKPSPELDKLLVCIENCLGKSFVVTSTTKRRESGQHPAGKAADIRYKGPGTTPFTAEEFLCCGGKCGAGFGLDEYLHPSKNATGPHIHIQIPRGKLGGRGDIPPDCVPTPTCDEKKEKQEEGHHDKRRE
jgi:RHS repeat-associated protein